MLPLHDMQEYVVCALRYYNSTTGETVRKFSRIFEMCVSWGCSAERECLRVLAKICAAAIGNFYVADASEF